MPYAAIGIRCLIGIIFLTSAISKSVGRQAFPSFVASLRDMRLLPPQTVTAVGGCVVLAEFTSCTLLLMPHRLLPAAGLGLAALLLTVFTAAIAVTVRRGSRTPCRCFGASTTPLGPRHLIRNTVLAALAVLGALWTVGAGYPTALSRSVVPAGLGLLLGGLVTVLDDLVALFHPTQHGPGAARQRPARPKENHDAVPHPGPGAGGRPVRAGSHSHPGRREEAA
ncbi:Methylamine utilisation protein MauE [Streptomyces sp. 2224.1]|nr:Methylamine utilisation protein MauE [Streptomyces sp. 2112.3]SED77567.1 Methylamine utilisation protein MauE [Streptomyces sp. 2224.1]